MKMMFSCATLVSVLLSATALAKDELYCKKVAPQLVALWQAEGRPADMVLRHDEGFSLVSVRHAGSLTSISLQGDFKGVVEDGGADGIVDKVEGGGIFGGGNYDSSRHRGNFSDAQAKYEKECEKLAKVLLPPPAQAKLD